MFCTKAFLDVPLSSLKLYYADRDCLLGLRINASIQEYKSIADQTKQRAMSSPLYDVDSTVSLPYFSADSSLLEAFATPPLSNTAPFSLMPPYIPQTESCSISLEPSTASSRISTHSWNSNHQTATSSSPLLTEQIATASAQTL